MVFATAMVSCGGGGGGSDNAGNNSTGADFFTISVDSGAPYTYTEAVSDTFPYYDPYLRSSVTGTTSAYLYAYTSGAPRMEIYIAGTSAGTYNIADGNAVYYTPDGGPNYNCSIAFSGSSGTITITEFSPTAGGPIKGSFDVIAKYGTYNASSAHLTASFSITRN